MKEQELTDTAQPSEETPIVVTTDDGELLWVTEDAASPADGAAAVDGAESAQIVVVETDDGQQQIQLVTEDGGQLLALPPELASRLKENLSDLVAGQGVEQVIVTGEEEQEGEEGDSQDGEGQLVTIQVASPEQDGSVEAEEAADERASDSNSRQGDEGAEVGDALTGFLKVEEEAVASEGDDVDENVGEECVEEEIGEFLGDLGQAGSADDMEAEQTQPVGVSAPTEAAQSTSSDWMESTVTSASGAELKIRVPSVAALDVATLQAAQRDLPVVRTAPVSGPHPPPPHKKRSRAELDAWAARTRRRASRGIARAVAAVRRAEDSDSFDSGEEEEEEEPQPLPPAGHQPKRGRGRPRKVGGFSCQLCSRRLETQAQFFQHLRDHYEKPGGQAAAGASPVTAAAGEPLGPISEEHGDGGDTPVLNVDIIAAESADFGCERCERRFYTEDDLERHRKVHIREALEAEAESSEPESEQEAAGSQEDGPESEAPQFPQFSAAPEPLQGLGGGASAEYEMKNLKKCEECPKLFTTQSSLRNHRQRLHNADGTPVSATNAAKFEYECDECHVTYTSQKIHERHRRLHEDRAAGRLPHRCGSCGASFLTSMLLAHHGQKEHPETCRRRRRPADGPVRPNGRPPGSSDKNRQAVYDQIRELEHGLFSCVICGKIGKTKNQMFYHVSIKHKALEGHKCDTCEKTFFTETALRVHERTHTGERPFVCDYCSRRFRQQADLNSHVMSLHTMERPFRCRFCAKAFARKYSMTIHMRCHTNERNYKCPICNKGFRASTYLTGHMKIHTGERAHSCPICQKSFRMRSDMKRHIFTHSRDRPHPRSLRALTVQVAGGEKEDGVMLLDPAQLCLQLVTGENGEESMVITEGDQTMVLDGSQTIIDEQTGQLMVPESAMTELDETAVASMYLMAEGESGSLELT